MDSRSAAHEKDKSSSASSAMSFNNPSHDMRVAVRSQSSNDPQYPSAKRSGPLPPAEPESPSATRSPSDIDSSDGEDPDGLYDPATDDDAQESGDGEVRLDEEPETGQRVVCHFSTCQGQVDVSRSIESTVYFHTRSLWRRRISRQTSFIIHS